MWARTLVHELVRCGLDIVSMAPGSRSTPLVLAAHSHPELRLVTHVDERSAAYFALGVGKASGRPAAVITTSGTATANLFPAVVEASQSGTPLLVLTADRPPRLRGADANQAIDQLHLFGRYVRRFVELGPASDDARSLRALRSVAARAFGDACGADPGPVHLNAPFDKPLEPAGGPGELAQGAEAVGGPPLTTVLQPEAHLPAAALDAVADLLESSRRGVIVAGPAPRPWRSGPEVVGLAAATGLPLLADPLSGARHAEPGDALVLGAYDLLLRADDVRCALAPDLILRLGGAPVSASCLSWLEEAGDATQAVVAPGRRWRDHLATASFYVHADLDVFCRELAGRVRPRAGTWRDRWARLEQAARAAAPGPVEAGLTEAGVASAVVEHTPERAWLLVSNSMPVRDVDTFGPPRRRKLDVLANRGASGIDGIVSTALGASVGSGRPVVALLGDLALIHDMNGLLATREPEAAVVFVVVHNDGGGIFHQLPIREFEPAFTRHFATPHGLDFRHAADLYDLAHAVVDSRDVLTDAIESGIREGGCRVIEVRADREANRINRIEAAERVATAARQALKEDQSE